MSEVCDAARFLLSDEAFPGRKKVQVIGAGGTFDVIFGFCFSTVIFLSSGEKSAIFKMLMSISISRVVFY